MLIRRAVTSGTGRTLVLWWLAENPSVCNWASILPSPFRVNSYAALSSVCKPGPGRTFSADGCSGKLCSRFHLSWGRFVGAALAFPELNTSSTRSRAVLPQRGGKGGSGLRATNRVTVGVGCAKTDRWQRRCGCSQTGRAFRACGQNRCTGPFNSWLGSCV